MNSKITKGELALIKNQSFLLSKFEILDKITFLLEITRAELETLQISNKHITGKSKISKGENYKNLPYFVLDCPAYFTKEDTFAYRTMFWWGNFFSCTLHLQGRSLKKNRNNLVTNFDKLLDKDIYICIGETPWEYHYGKDNYVLLDNSHKQFITECNFLKLSKKMELEDWDRLSTFSKDFFEQILLIIKQ